MITGQARKFEHPPCSLPVWYSDATTSNTRASTRKDCIAVFSHHDVSGNFGWNKVNARGPFPHTFSGKGKGAGNSNPRLLRAKVHASVVDNLNVVLQSVPINLDSISPPFTPSDDSLAMRYVSIQCYTLPKGYGDKRINKKRPNSRKS